MCDWIAEPIASQDVEKIERCAERGRAATIHLRAKVGTQIGVLVLGDEPAPFAAKWWAISNEEPPIARRQTVLRCIFGNPFHPFALAPSCTTATVLALAHLAYEDRILPAGILDSQRLAVLADALEDAGCTDPDILVHLRGPGPHVRGCWVVDLLLGKS
jgi:hypothetical protein